MALLWGCFSECEFYAATVWRMRLYRIVLLWCPRSDCTSAWGWSGWKGIHVWLVAIFQEAKTGCASRAVLRQSFDVVSARDCGICSEYHIKPEKHTTACLRLAEQECASCGITEFFMWCFFLIKDFKSLNDVYVDACSQAALGNLEKCLTAP